MSREFDEKMFSVWRCDWDSQVPAWSMPLLKSGMRPVLFFSQSRDELGEADLNHGKEKWRKRSRREEKFGILWSVVQRKIILQ